MRLEESAAPTQLSVSEPTTRTWQSVGKIRIPCVTESGKDLTTDQIIDRLAEGVRGHLVVAELPSGPKVNGKPTYRIHIDNESPLIPDGLSIQGIKPPKGEDARPSMLAGFTLPPHRTMDLPAAGSLVERLGLKHGVKVVAADLSSL